MAVHDVSVRRGSFSDHRGGLVCGCTVAGRNGDGGLVVQDSPVTLMEDDIIPYTLYVAETYRRKTKGQILYDVANVSAYATIRRCFDEGVPGGVCAMQLWLEEKRELGKA